MKIFTLNGPRLMLLLLFYAGACVTAGAQSAAENAIVHVQGRVEVKRAGWNYFVRAGVGTLVKNGDLLRLADGARAKVACADSTVRDVQERSHRVQCGTARPVIVFKGSRVSRVRTGVPIGAFPILVSPRMTKLLNGRPLLRWMPMTGAATYRVSIMRGTVEHWGQDVSASTELRYPESAPPLTPGVTYKVVITAGRRNSNEERLPNLGFSVLSEEQTQSVRAVEKSITDLNLPEAPTKFLIANLYATWGLNLENPRDDTKALNAEAIELLETISATQPEAVVLRMLGDLYLTLGLTISAERHYLRALEVSAETDDTQGKALAQYALGQIYKERLNKAAAVQRLQTAKELFQSFGDIESVSKINDELSELQR